MEKKVLERLIDFFNHKNGIAASGMIDILSRRRRFFISPSYNDSIRKRRM